MVYVGECILDDIYEWWFLLVTKWSVNVWWCWLWILYVVGGGGSCCYSNSSSNSLGVMFWGKIIFWKHQLKIKIEIIDFDVQNQWFFDITEKAHLLWFAACESPNDWKSWHTRACWMQRTTQFRVSSCQQLAHFIEAEFCILGTLSCGGVAKYFPGAFALWE